MICYFKESKHYFYFLKKSKKHITIQIIIFNLKVINDCLSFKSTTMKNLQTLQLKLILFLMVLQCFSFAEIKAQNNDSIYPNLEAYFIYEEHFKSVDSITSESLLIEQLKHRVFNDSLIVRNPDTLCILVLDSLQVYYKLNNDTSLHLLYDFSLEIGDTAYYDNFLQEYAIVIDTLAYSEPIISGIHPKIMQLSNGDEWLRGIGSLRHPFRPIASQSLINYNLCYSQIYFSNDSLTQNNLYEEYEYKRQNCAVGVENNTNSNKIKIFPNPVKNHFSIESSENIKINQIKIYNFSGQEIYSEAIAQKQVQVNITLPDLANGIYIIQIDTENGLINKKINILN